MDNEEMIKNYTAGIARRKINPPDIACRNCRQKPESYELQNCMKPVNGRCGFSLGILLK
ncbi:MAG: hypothetical protein GXP53_13355 [Deltaproteobacteria bacterium]|nr:hypothetical protein [Deltaproteobacteria bacterium]